MIKLTKSAGCAIALVAAIGGNAFAQGTPPAAAAKVDSETISGLGARNIGSAAMSGRIAAIAAVHEGNRLTVYLGSASGGVWKSENGGTTYKPVNGTTTPSTFAAGVTKEPSAFALTTISPNSSGVCNRPCARTV